VPLSALKLEGILPVPASDARQQYNGRPESELRLECQQPRIMPAGRSFFVSEEAKKRVYIVKEINAVWP